MAKGGGADVLVKIGGDVTEFQNSLGGLLSDVQSAVAKMNPVMALASAAVLGIGTSAAMVAQEFEEATKIMTAGTGLTGDALKGLQADFKAVFQEVPQDAAEVGEAITQVNVRLGLAGEAAQIATKGFLDLSDAIGEQSKPLVEAITKAMNAWNISADEARLTQDKLLIVHQKTGVSVTELAGILAESEPVLKQWGLSWEQSATMIGEFEKAGVPAGEVVGALTKAIKAMSEQGITPSLAEFEKLINSIQHSATESQSTELALTAFGKSGAKMAEIIRGGKVDLDSLSEAFANASGAVDDLDKRTDTIGEKFTVLWHKIQTDLEPVGKALIDFGTTIIDGPFGLEAMMRGFTKWGEVLTGLREKVVPGFVKSIAEWTFGLGENTTATKANAEEAGYLATALGKTATQSGVLQAKNATLFSSITQGTKSFSMLDTVTKSVEKSTKQVGETSLKTTSQVKGLDEAHKQLEKQLQAQKDTTKLLSAASADYDAAIRTLTPHIHTIADAEKEVQTGRTGLLSASVLLARAEADLAGVQRDHPRDLDAIKAASERVEAARGNLKAATGRLRDAENDLTEAQKAQKQALEDLATSMKTALDAMDLSPDVKSGLEDINEELAKMPSSLAQIGTNEQLARIVETEQALKALGITPRSELVKLAATAEENFQKIRDDGIATQREVEDAWLEAYKKEAEVAAATYGQIPAADQVMRAKLLQQQKDYEENSLHSWQTLFNTIRGSFDGLFSALNHDLVTLDWGKMKDDAISAAEKIAEGFVTKLFKPLEDRISGTLTDLLMGLAQKIPGLGGLGTIGMGPTTPGINGNPVPGLGGIPGLGGDPGGIPGVDGMPGVDLASGGAPSAASSMGGFLSAFNAVTGAVSAITGVLGLFGIGQEGQKDRLSGIKNDTSYLAWRGSEGGEHDAVLDTRNILTGGISFNLARAADDLTAIRWPVEQMRDFTLNSLPVWLDKIIQMVPTVIVKNYIDGHEIAGIVETDIEFKTRLATAT